MRRTVRLILPGLAALALALPVQAATFTVTKTADTLDGACDRDCSLREAVTAANEGEPTGGADVVVVPPGIYVLTRTGTGEDGSATGDLDLNDQMILLGAGAGSTVLDGGGFDRVLETRAPAEIYGVTIRNGRVEGHGGGLFARVIPGDQPVLLHRVVVSGNQAQRGGSGGGIAAFGFVEVRESAILGNHAEGDGGGISTGTDGSFSLTNVTVSGNLAHGSGGGLYSAGGRITASTIVLNEAHVSGGGVAVLTLPFPATSDDGLEGSILAQNTAPANPDCEPGLISIAFNVFGVADCQTGSSDRAGTAASPLRAVEEALRSDLGPTPVHALAGNSPARHLVPAAVCPPADQVGQDRTTPCDAGSWEEPDPLEIPACVPGGSVLCLQGGAFRVSAAWREQQELPANPAHAAALTDNTGNFWFFGPDNLEIMVKVLAGCGVNDRWWVFASGLTNLGVELKVEELRTGRIWIYEHEPGTTFAPRADTDAFPCVSGPGILGEQGTPLGSSGHLPADVLLVTKTADTDDGACDHDCSLREAVLAANTTNRTRVIVLGPGVHALSIPGAAEEAGHTGDLDVAKRVVILGAGARRTVLDGGRIDRVLDVRSGGSLELHGVTVRNGLARQISSDGTGGGIRALGYLALIRSSVESNAADEVGGGIWAFGVLTVRDSTISGNTSGFAGGGLGASLAEMENVTISGNRAGKLGGGFFYPADTAALRHVTITGNSAPLGAGIASVQDTCAGDFPCYGPLVMERTIIAGNPGEAEGGPNCYGLYELPPQTGGFNVFGAGCAPGPGDVAGTPAHPLDARLSPLGDHGGPTFTHVPLPGSPAIDAAPSSTCNGTDQRGFARPVNACDAGAVERRPSCEPDAETLCLGADNRFRVTARWAAQGADGPGEAVPLALDTGAFWFFDATNLELTVKVLDGCGVNQRFWVFLSGLTDVGVEVTAEDTLTGRTWTHTHPAGTPLQPRLDTNALDSCGS